jgi:hypothetical protein
MMTTTTLRRAPEGRRQRPFTLEVVLLPLDGRLPGFRVYCREIARDGMFIPSTRPVRLDTLLRLKISARGRPLLEVTGHVVHVIPGQGFGLRFLDVDDGTRLCLTQLMASCHEPAPRCGTIHATPVDDTSVTLPRWRGKTRRRS